MELKLKSVSSRRVCDTPILEIGLGRANGNRTTKLQGSLADPSWSSCGDGKSRADDSRKLAPASVIAVMRRAGRTATCPFPTPSTKSFPSSVRAVNLCALARVPTEQSVDGKTSCFAFAEQGRAARAQKPARVQREIL